MVVSLALLSPLAMLGAPAYAADGTDELRRPSTSSATMRGAAGGGAGAGGDSLGSVGAGPGLGSPPLISAAGRRVYVGRSADRVARIKAAKALRLARAAAAGGGAASVSGAGGGGGGGGGGAEESDDAEVDGENAEAAASPRAIAAAAAAFPATAAASSPTATASREELLALLAARDAQLEETKSALAVAAAGAIASGAEVIAGAPRPAAR